MQQWDYTHVLVKMLSGYYDKWEIHSSVRTLVSEGSGDFYPVLFQLGAAGWEIMSVYERVRDSDGAMLTTMWLKRAKSTSPVAPAMSELELRIARYALANLEGKFVLRTLHQAFNNEISYEELRNLSVTWEARALLTQSKPRKLTPALIALCQEQQ